MRPGHYEPNPETLMDWLMLGLFTYGMAMLFVSPFILCIAVGMVLAH